MAMSAHIFQRQRGGSTLIGLLLGLCLGMLALIKWPHLEGPLRALLAEHDISLTSEFPEVVSALEGRLTQPEAIAPQEKIASHSGTSRSSIETQVAEPALVGQTANQLAEEPTEAIQSERFHDESTKNARPAITPETREVWQPFSSESAAHAFAKVVSKALDIEVETLRHSDHKVVPIVRCAQQVMCDDVEAKITAYLAGPNNAGILR